MRHAAAGNGLMDAESAAEVESARLLLGKKAPKFQKNGRRIVDNYLPQGWSWAKEDA